MNKGQVIEATEDTITRYEVWTHRDEQGRVIWTKEVIVTRDSKGRFVTWKPAELYRIAITIRNYPIHHVYYDYTLYYYHYDKKHIESIIEDLKQEAIKGAEKYIGYPYDEWWSKPKEPEEIREMVGEEPITELRVSDIEPVKFNVDLIGTYEEEWKKRERK